MGQGRLWSFRDDVSPAGVRAGEAVADSRDQVIVQAIPIDVTQDQCVDPEVVVGDPVGDGAHDGSIGAGVKIGFSSIYLYEFR